jgi:hypothetical protein
MRLLTAVAFLTLIAGAIFALQGLRLLPSPVMYGRPEWIVIGAAMVLGSVAALWRLARRDRR